MGGVVIDMRHITKAFHGVRVLQDVDFDLREGEVHALVGGNGAGKSTLMKILEGVHSPDAGEIVIDGRPVRLSSSLEGRTHGIAMIFQEFSLIPTLTVSQNIFLTHEARRLFGLLNDRECERTTRELFSEIGVEVDPRLPVSALSTGHRQLTEIVKALSQNARALIMDEPTASLAKSETDSLFHIIAQLKARGMGIVYISHRMEEIFRIADRVTILRDGKAVATEAIVDLTPREDDRAYRRPECGSVIPVAAADNRPLWRPTSRAERRGIRRAGKTDQPEGIRRRSRRARRPDGERSHRAPAVYIRHSPHHRGGIRVRGRRIPIRSPKDAMTAGIVLIPEDRRSQGLVMDHALKDNILLPLLDKFTRHGIIHEADAQRKVEEYVKKLNIRTDSIFKIVRELSGGNQQKVVIAKWLGAEPDIFLMDEPTAGVDIGAKGEIIALVRQLAGDLGKAVLLVSSELPELLAVSDRILFMRSGRVESEKQRSEIESEAALHHLIQGN